MDERDRKAILARRARFVAAAVAAAGLTSFEGCARNPEPQACLTTEVVVPEVDSAAQPTEQDDAGIPRSDARAPLGAETDAAAHKPRICLDFEY
jgi:hypothetical protein